MNAVAWQTRREAAKYFIVTKEIKMAAHEKINYAACLSGNHSRAPGAFIGILRDGWMKPFEILPYT